LGKIVGCEERQREAVGLQVTHHLHEHPAIIERKFAMQQQRCAQDRPEHDRVEQEPPLQRAAIDRLGGTDCSRRLGMSPRDLAELLDTQWTWTSLSRFAPTAVWSPKIEGTKRIDTISVSTLQHKVQGCVYFEVQH